VCVCTADKEPALPSVVHVEMEQKKELIPDQQLKEANDTAARLQDRLRQAESREIQLLVQVDILTDELRQLQQQKKEFDDFKRRTALNWEHEMKSRSSKISAYFWLITVFGPRKRVPKCHSVIFLLLLSVL